MNLHHHHQQQPTSKMNLHHRMGPHYHHYLHLRQVVSFRLAKLKIQRHSIPAKLVSSVVATGINHKSSTSANTSPLFLHHITNKKNISIQLKWFTNPKCPFCISLIYCVLLADPCARAGADCSTPCALFLIQPRPQIQLIRQDPYRKIVHSNQTY